MMGRLKLLKCYVLSLELVCTHGLAALQMERSFSQVLEELVHVGVNVEKGGEYWKKTFVKALGVMKKVESCYSS